MLFSGNLQPIVSFNEFYLILAVFSCLSLSNNFVGGGMPDSDISPLNMRSLFGIVGVFVACIHYKESLFLRHKSHTER